ncbi:MAG: hypothetical protein JSS35_06220 [Proteobacteria bacterium]|nr:hypothetical protein [Pseudomonadota bacterium]
MAKPKTARANPALRWNAIRQVHVYISVFVAPSLIFFAVTGAFQTFRIPDRPDAPVVLQKLARAHKDSVFAVKPARPKKPEGAKVEGAGGGGEHRRHDDADASKVRGDSPSPPPAGAPDKPAKPQPKPATEAVKWFFVMAAIGMTVSTLLGLWMALAYHKRRRLLLVLLVAGALIPLALFAAAL